MISFNIKKEIAKFKSIELKEYHFLYENSGFEMGFGMSGVYPGHSHLYFCDILFSPLPISTSDADGKAVFGNLIVIPPKTFLGEVKTDDFFFMKFSTTNEFITLPDKIESIERSGVISSFIEIGHVKLPWYRNHLSEESFIEIDYKNSGLLIKYGQSGTFYIT